MPTVPENNIGIEASWLVNNRTYTSPYLCTKKKLMLHSTATPGAPAKNFVPGWNTATASVSTEFMLDDTTILQFLPVGKDGKNCYRSWHCGSTGNTTHIATEVCEPIETQLILVNYQTQGIGATYPRTYSTKRIQMELKYLGYYTGSVNGSFGTLTDAAVRAYQKDQGLTVTGMVDKTTLKKLAARSGSYCAYDVAGATDFFNTVYNKAVSLFAFLCTYIGGDPNDIVCHSEGYAMGIASNHADVNHWFPLHGKTMDDFRSDVAKCIAGTYIPLGQSCTLSTFDLGYLEDLGKVVTAGIINTPSYWQGLVTATTVSNNNIMALFRQAGSYFCNKSFVYGVDVIDDIIDIGDAESWKMGDGYTAADAEQLCIAIGKILLDTNDDIAYATAIQAMVDVGIMNSPAWWLGLVGGSSVVNPANMQALFRKTGAYLCTQSYQYAISAVKRAIGMNSEEYWRAGNYSVLNAKYLIRAIAGAL